MTTITFPYSFGTGAGLGALTIDGTGNLFGYTAMEDTRGNVSGNLVELVNNGGSYSAPTPIFAYNGAFANGGTSSSGQPGPNEFPVLVDPSHNIFYDSSGYLPGGDYGEVYEISATGTGYSGAATKAATFTGADGYAPYSALVSDAQGDIFGTTSSGASQVFEISNTGVFSVLATVTSGYSPSGLYIDPNGNLIGTSTVGPVDLSLPPGTQAGFGFVFEVKKTASGYENTTTTLAAFDGNGPVGSGSAPSRGAGVVADAAGNLFGQTTSSGFSGYGVIYEIPKVGSGYGALEVLADNGVLTSGGGPLIVDAAGNLFGYGSNFMANPAGTVFELAKKPDGSYSSRPTVLANFAGASATGVKSLVADASGNLIGTTTVGGANGSGALFELTNTPFVTCFASGTLIDTPDGPRKVETLAEGERLLTASGEARPIRWVGRRRVSCVAQPEHSPVRVRAHAFGRALPRRDLFLSPDHALFVDGALVPVKYLIDGDRVAQVVAPFVTYHHVELDSHDVVLAEGLPAESYLDRDDRQSFDGAVVRLRPAFAQADSLAWDAAGCAPMVIAGPALDRIRARLTRPVREPRLRQPIEVARA